MGLSVSKSIEEDRQANETRTRARLLAAMDPIKREIFTRRSDSDGTLQDLTASPSHEDETDARNAGIKPEDAMDICKQEFGDDAGFDTSHATSKPEDSNDAAIKKEDVEKEANLGQVDSQTTGTAGMTQKVDGRVEENGDDKGDLDHKMPAVDTSLSAAPAVGGTINVQIVNPLVTRFWYRDRVSMPPVVAASMTVDNGNTAKRGRSLDDSSISAQPNEPSTDGRPAKVQKRLSPHQPSPSLHLADVAAAAATSNDGLNDDVSAHVANNTSSEYPKIPTNLSAHAAFANNDTAQMTLGAPDLTDTSQPPGHDIAAAAATASATGNSSDPTAAFATETREPPLAATTNMTMQPSDNPCTGIANSNNATASLGHQWGWSADMLASVQGGQCGMGAGRGGAHDSSDAHVHGHGMAFTTTTTATAATLATFIAGAAAGGGDNIHYNMPPSRHGQWAAASSTNSATTRAAASSAMTGATLPMDNTDTSSMFPAHMPPLRDTVRHLKPPPQAANTYSHLPASAASRKPPPPQPANDVQHMLNATTQANVIAHEPSLPAAECVRLANAENVEIANDNDRLLAQYNTLRVDLLTHRATLGGNDDVAECQPIRQPTRQNKGWTVYFCNLRKQNKQLRKAIRDGNVELGLNQQGADSAKRVQEMAGPVFAFQHVKVRGKSQGVVAASNAPADRPLATFCRPSGREWDKSSLSLYESRASEEYVEGSRQVGGSDAPVESSSPILQDDLVSTYKAHVGDVRQDQESAKDEFETNGTSDVTDATLRGESALQARPTARGRVDRVSPLASGSPGTTCNAAATTIATAVTRASTHECIQLAYADIVEIDRNEPIVTNVTTSNASAADRPGQDLDTDFSAHIKPLYFLKRAVQDALSDFYSVMDTMDMVSKIERATSTFRATRTYSIPAGTEIEEENGLFVAEMKKDRAKFEVGKFSSSGEATVALHHIENFVNERDDVIVGHGAQARGEKWRSQIKVGGTTRHIGNTFLSEEEAKFAHFLANEKISKLSAARCASLSITELKKFFAAVELHVIQVYRCGQLASE